MTVNQKSRCNKRAIKGYQESQRLWHRQQQQQQINPPTTPIILHRRSVTEPLQASPDSLGSPCSLCVCLSVCHGCAGEERAERQGCEGLVEEELDSHSNHHLGDTG